MAQITKLVSSKAELQTQFQFIFKSHVIGYHALLPSQSPCFKSFSAMEISRERVSTWGLEGTR